jgi:manganese transport protein
MKARGMVKVIGVFGPAVLVSVELFDPASIVTSTISGALFGFSILWAAFYSGMLLIAVQETSARLGVVTGKTLAENVYERYRKGYSYLFFSAFLFLDLGTMTAEMIGLSLAISFFTGLPYAIAIVISIIITAFLAIFFAYALLEKVIMFLVFAIFIAFAYFLFALHIPPGTILYHSLVPSLDPSSFFAAEAIFGSTIMPTYVILHSGLVSEKGWAHDHHKPVDSALRDQAANVKSERTDSVMSLFIGTALNLMIISTAAVLLSGRSVDSFFAIAYPFSHQLGTTGILLFTVAFACAGIAAVITVGLGSTYNTLGFLGYKERFKRKRFRSVFIVWLLITAVAAFFLPNPIFIMVLTQYLNAVFLPVVLVPLLTLTRDSSLMGPYRIRTGMVIVLCAIIAITTTLFAVYLGSFLLGTL